MSKKVAKRKKVHYAHSHHHHQQSNNLLIVVAGGFVVILILIYMIGNTNNLFSNNATATEVIVEEEVVSEDVVTMANNSYSPATLTVNAGDTVDFVNNDTVAHTATSDNGSFDTGNIAPGESKTVTFDTPGTYNYYCTYHPNMTGTIVVK